MECSTCGHRNLPDAKFCANCGSALARVCPVCAHEVDADARFCSNCGHALAPEMPASSEPAGEDLSRYVPETLLRKIRAARAGAVMRGERRTVTMLFADIQGSTAAAEQLDPEEWADIVNGAFERLIAPVYRYEGTLARLQGDAVLAFFGAPIAHEDDPVRAVRAGLDMRDAIRAHAADVEARTGVPLAIRVGINTGLVVVGEVGSDLRVEYTALGDAINVAARMEQTAEPGTVRITQRSAALLGNGFVLEEIGPVEVKGRTGPVTALRVVGVAPDVPAEVDLVPLVGRERERRELRDVLDRLVAGVGGVVTVVGEPGIGKSRLVAAMHEDAVAGFRVASTSTQDGDISWLEGSCRSYDTGVPHAPFLDVASHWLDLADVRDEGALTRIRARLEGFGGATDPDRATFLANVLGAPLPPDAAAFVAELETPVLHERTTDAIVSYLEDEARHRPVVLVLNDLHWADALSLGLTERLIGLAERVPLALVLALRPVRDEPAWRLVEIAAREAAHRHTPIQLDTLDAQATEALVAHLLGDRALGQREREEILRRADGNPLFVEELVGAVSEGGASVVPSSLAGMLGARLDRLDDDARLVAEVASVVGREFTSASVEAMVEGLDVATQLGALVRDGVLVELRRVPPPVYAFRHVLIQEAAYGTVLLKDRRRLHLRLAAHLAESDPDVPHEIARHYLAADEADSAFGWLIEAGARASRAMALAEAIRLFTTALDHVPADADPDDLARAHLGLGEAYSLVPDLDHASAAYQSLADLGREVGRPALEVRALNRLGFNAVVIGADFAGGTAYLEHAREVATIAGDELGLAEYHMNSCFVAVAQGELDRAIEHDEATARIGATSGSGPIRVAGLVRRVANHIHATDFEGVESALAEARRAATEVGSAESLAVLDVYVDAALRQRDGELRAQLDLMLGAIDTLARFGSFYTAMVQAEAARAALSLGDIEVARDLIAGALRAADAQGQAFATGAASATLALCRALFGDEQESRRHRGRALEALTVPVGDFLASTVWADLGLASIALGAWDQAEADIELGLQASSSSRFWERPRLLSAGARVALVRGRTQRAADLLAESVEHARARGFRQFDPEHEFVAALVAESSGNLEAAEAGLESAEEQALAMGLRLLVCEIIASRAEVARARGSDHDAAAHLRRRGDLVAAIGDQITDPTLRAELFEHLGGLQTSLPESGV